MRLIKDELSLLFRASSIEWRFVHYKDINIYNIEYPIEGKYSPTSVNTVLKYGDSMQIEPAIKELFYFSLIVFLRVWNKSRSRYAPSSFTKSCHHTMEYFSKIDTINSNIISCIPDDSFSWFKKANKSINKIIYPRSSVSITGKPRIFKELL